jgi:tetratricopeptide (TPR) repeat protein
VSTRSPVVNVFAREGEYWTVVFDGRVSRLRDAKGLRYLDHLLRRPGEEVHALALVAAVDAPAPDRRASAAAVAEGLAVAGLGDAGPVVDGAALAAYRRRFDELREELAEADAFADGERASRAQDELDALAEQLTAGVGLGGRARRAGSAAERARLAVTKAIRSSLRKLYEVDPALANHLDGAVRTGTFCVYRPAPGFDVVWRHEATPAAAPGPPAPTARAWPAFRPPARRTAHVGRPVERRLAAELVAAAAAGRGGLVLVSGEAGIGKTRLTEEAAAEAHDRGTATLLGRCLEAEQAVPWLPLLEVLEQLAGQLPDEELLALLGDAGPEVTRVVPSLRRRFPELPPPLDLPAEQARHLLYSSLRDVLLRLAAVRPLLLVLEDLHWADSATLTLLEHLVDRLETARILVLGTYRSDEAAVGTPLAHTHGRLVRHPACSRVVLRPVGVDEVGELAAALCGRTPPPGVSARLRADTDGNPFFVEELCKHLAEGGRLYGEDGEIRAELATEEVDLPDSLRFILGHRLERLSPSCRKVLNVAAVIGRDLDVELLADIAGVDDDALLDAVDEALTAGVLVAAPAGFGPAAGDQLTFSHALVRQAALGELSGIRRARLHLEVAAALKRRHGQDPERAAEIADHLQRAGAGADPATTASYLLLAGRRSLESAAYEDAAARLRRALALVPETDRARRAEILADLGYAARGMAGLEEALQSWSDALELLDGAPEADVALVGKVCRALGRNLDNTGRLDDAFSVVQRGLRMVGDRSGAERSRLLSAMAYTLGLRGDHTEAEARLEEAAAIADALDDARLRADVHLSRNCLLFTAGRLAECVDTADEAGAALMACGQAWEALQTQVTVLWPSAWLGRVADARRRVADCEPQAERIGHLPGAFLARRTRVLLDLVATGDLERFASGAAADVAFCRANRLRWLADAYVFAGMAAFWLGDWDQAAAQFRAGASVPAPPVYAGRYNATLLTFHAWNGDGEAFDRLRADIRSSVSRLGLEQSVGTLAADLAEVEGLLVLGRHAEAAARRALVTATMADGLVLRPPDLRIVAALAGATAALAGDLGASQAHFAEARRLVDELPHPRERPDVDLLEALALLGAGRKDGVGRARALLGDAVEGYRALGMERHARVAEGRAATLTSA